MKRASSTGGMSARWRFSIRRSSLSSMSVRSRTTASMVGNSAMRWAVQRRSPTTISYLVAPCDGRTVIG